MSQETEHPLHDHISTAEVNTEEELGQREPRPETELTVGVVASTAAFTRRSAHVEAAYTGGNVLRYRAR